MEKNVRFGYSKKYMRLLRAVENRVMRFGIPTRKRLNGVHEKQFSDTKTKDNEEGELLFH